METLLLRPNSSCFNSVTCLTAWIRGDRGGAPEEAGARSGGPPSGRPGRAAGAAGQRAPFPPHAKPRSPARPAAVRRAARPQPCCPAPKRPPPGPVAQQGQARGWAGLTPGGRGENGSGRCGALPRPLTRAAGRGAVARPFPLSSRTREELKGRFGSDRHRRKRRGFSESPRDPRA